MAYGHPSLLATFEKVAKSAYGHTFLRVAIIPSCRHAFLLPRLKNVAPSSSSHSLKPCFFSKGSHSHNPSLDAPSPSHNPHSPAFPHLLAATVSIYHGNSHSSPPPLSLSHDNPNSSHDRYSPVQPHPLTIVSHHHSASHHLSLLVVKRFSISLSRELQPSELYRRSQSSSLRPGPHLHSRKGAVPTVGAETETIVEINIADFIALPGRSVQCLIDGKPILAISPQQVGNRKLMVESGTDISDKVKNILVDLEESTKIRVLVAHDNIVIRVLEISNPLERESYVVIKRLMLAKKGNDRIFYGLIIEIFLYCFILFFSCHQLV
ncbi:serine/threonine protein kinase Ran1 [Stylosanthes scabra]|uniref:Serine/threonine protein kinase Ran1 n=1 Tax=Stylosanthes scabra TaxID=79078 RepID=A0ABU6RUH2_9FABA|nr:serine/threonine protein kinase Ran1 [Stylosanthes scabra]